MDIDSASSLQHKLDLDTIRSGARELETTLRDCEEDSLETEEFLNECALNFHKRIEEIASELSDCCFFQENELDECIERSTEELNLVVAESMRKSEEIEALMRAYWEDFSNLGIEFESLMCSLNCIALQGPQQVSASDGYPRPNEDRSSTIDVCNHDKSELLELDNLIEKKNLILRSIEGLDWFVATEQIEDALSGVKVIAIDQNCVRLSIQTYISIPESILSQQRIVIDAPSEVNHELLIDIVEGTLIQKSVEIYPNDVHIDNIRNAATDFGKSSLVWLLSQVQNKISLCAMRHFLVKNANQSGYSLEYSDKDEMMIARLVEGVNVFLKVPPDWPMRDSPLKLASIKSSNHRKKGFSSSYESKVKDEANSQAAEIRQSLLSFLGALEKLLVQ